MTERLDLAALACEDCIPTLAYRHDAGIAGPVLVALVEHDPTCPRLAAHGDLPVPTEYGVIVHVARDDAPERQ